MLTAEPEDGFITADGLRLHHLEWGDPAGTPVVLLHGFLQSARSTWTLTAPRFADRHRVIAVDARGHGESDWDPDARYTWTQYVHDLERFVDGLGLGSFALVGHSIGGSIALAYAARHAPRVGHLVLVDAGARPPEAVTAMLGRTHSAAKLPLRFETRAAAERCAKTQVHRAGRDFALEHGMIKREDGSYGWRADVAGLLRGRLLPDRIRDGGLWPEVEAVRSPTLMLRAGRSHAVDPAAAARMVQVNPRIRLTVYPESRHWLHYDEPVRFHDDVEAFLQGRIS